MTTIVVDFSRVLSLGDVTVRIEDAYRRATDGPVRTRALTTRQRRLGSLHQCREERQRRAGDITGVFAACWLLLFLGGPVLLVGVVFACGALALGFVFVAGF